MRVPYAVQLGTRLISFSQDERIVRAKIVKYRSGDGEEIEEHIEVAYFDWCRQRQGFDNGSGLGLPFLEPLWERATWSSRMFAWKSKVGTYVCSTARAAGDTLECVEDTHVLAEDGGSSELLHSNPRRVVRYVCTSRMLAPF